MATISNLGVITLNRGTCFKVPLFLDIGTENNPIRLDTRMLP